MSLILEALRKSEAERRRGQTPDLLSDATPVAPAARAATRNRSTMVAVVIAAVATLLLVAWWLRSTAQPEPESSSIATAPAVSSADSPSPSTPAQSHLPVPAATASTRAPTTSPPAPLSPPSTAAPWPSQPTSAAATRTDSGPPTDSESAPAPVQTPTQVAAAELPAVPAASAFTSPDLPLRLSDLSSEERQQLPALKVSMHMWAPDAANRFAIIDGARVNEGDRVGEATVEAIQNDGVMLSWHGRRIRLPIR